MNFIFAKKLQYDEHIKVNSDDLKKFIELIEKYQLVTLAPILSNNKNLFNLTDSDLIDDVDNCTVIYHLFMPQYDKITVDKFITDLLHQKFDDLSYIRIFITITSNYGVMNLVDQNSRYWGQLVSIVNQICPSLI